MNELAVIVALAKCWAATCMRAGGERLDSEVAELTYLLGHDHKVDGRLLLDLQADGLIRWDNGNVVTDAGRALLAEVIDARRRGARRTTRSDTRGTRETATRGTAMRGMKRRG